MHFASQVLRVRWLKLSFPSINQHCWSAAAIFQLNRDRATFLHTGNLFYMLRICRLTS